MLLFACHFTNASAQGIQGARFLGYHYGGGAQREEEEKKQQLIREVAMKTPQA